MIYLFVYFVLALPYQAFTKFYLLEEEKKKRKRERGLEKKKRDDDTTTTNDTNDITTSSIIDFRKIKYYNTNDSIALIGDRWVLDNLSNIHLYFLTLLWIHAIFVNNAHTQSIDICILYSISRL